MQFWLRELPSLLFDGWWLAYRLMLIVVFMVSISLTMVSLALWCLWGIRWGW